MLCLVDARRPARLVKSAAERRSLRWLRPVSRTDVVVTFRVDCSGSILRWIEPVALLVDLFARALEIARASCEVLGFTTAA